MSFFDSDFNDILKGKILETFKLMKRGLTHKSTFASFVDILYNDTEQIIAKKQFYHKIYIEIDRFIDRNFEMLEISIMGMGTPVKLINTLFARYLQIAYNQLNYIRIETDGTGGFTYMDSYTNKKNDNIGYGRLLEMIGASLKRE